MGVDVEIVRDDPDWLSVAESFFSPAEFEAHIRETLDIIHDQGGLTLVPHPFCYYRGSTLWEDYRAEAIAAIAGLNIRDPYFWKSGIDLLDQLVTEAERSAG